MIQLHRYQLTHHRLNNGLTIVVMAFGLYLIAAPFLPQLKWWLAPPDISTTTQSSQATSAERAAAPIPDENILVIPRLGMNEIVHDGASSAELNKGAWLVPNTSQPNLESNTVIIGHRFTYAGPAVFYMLDKVKVGDEIVVDWQGKEYTYKVSTIRTVEPSEVSVQQPTTKAQLTLYTCTPLWSASHRLVLTAPLQGVRS